MTVFFKTKDGKVIEGTVVGESNNKYVVETYFIAYPSIHHRLLREINKKDCIPEFKEVKR